MEVLLSSARRSNTISRLGWYLVVGTFPVKLAKIPYLLRTCTKVPTLLYHTLIPALGIPPFLKIMQGTSTLVIQLNTFMPLAIIHHRVFPKQTDCSDPLLP